jgi:hypothetical protein
LTIKTESKREYIGKIGNLTPKIGKFAFKPSPVVWKRVKIRRIRRQVAQSVIGLFNSHLDLGRLIRSRIIHDYDLGQRELQP